MLPELRMLKAKAAAGLDVLWGWHVLGRFSLSLTKSVQLERMFLKFMEDKGFSNIFQCVEQMAKVAKHLRISEKSVVLAIGTHGSTTGTQEG